MTKEYWDIFYNEIVPEIINASDKQIHALRLAFENHKSMEYEACGTIEPDRSIAKTNKQEIENRVICVVERLCGEMNGPSAIFDVATQNQKQALAKLFNLRDYLRKKEAGKDG